MALKETAPKLFENDRQELVDRIEAPKLLVAEGSISQRNSFDI